MAHSHIPIYMYAHAPYIPCIGPYLFIIKNVFVFCFPFPGRLVHRAPWAARRPPIKNAADDMLVRRSAGSMASTPEGRECPKAESPPPQKGCNPVLGSPNMRRGKCRLALNSCCPWNGAGTSMHRCGVFGGRLQGNWTKTHIGFYIA